MLGRSHDRTDAELRAESPRQGRVFALAGVVQVWLLFARQLGLISGLHAKGYRVGFRPSAVSGQVKPVGGVGHGSFNPFSMASPESAWLEEPEGRGSAFENKNRIMALLCVLMNCFQATVWKTTLLEAAILASDPSWSFSPEAKRHSREGHSFRLMAFETVWLGGESGGTCGFPWVCFSLTGPPWATSLAIVSLRFLICQNRGRGLVSVL